MIFSMADRDTFDLPRREAGGADFDKILSRLDCDERESAGDAGLCGARGFGFGVFQSDARVGDDGFGGIGDGAGNDRYTGRVGEWGHRHGDLLGDEIADAGANEEKQNAEESDWRCRFALGIVASDHCNRLSRKAERPQCAGRGSHGIVVTEYMRGGAAQTRI